MRTRDCGRAVYRPSEEQKQMGTAGKYKEVMLFLSNQLEGVAGRVGDIPGKCS